MTDIVDQKESIVSLKQDVNTEECDNKPPEDIKSEVKYFECSSCILKERYEYFGRSPPFVKDYRLQEDVYVIEDPFLPPNRGEFLVLGAHCIKCNKSVCKDSNCSFYYSGTFCIHCAKENRKQFPKPVQEKLNRIIIP